MVKDRWGEDRKILDETTKEPQVYFSAFDFTLFLRRFDMNFQNVLCFRYVLVSLYSWLKICSVLAVFE